MTPRGKKQEDTANAERYQERKYLLSFCEYVYSNLIF